MICILASGLRVALQANIVTAAAQAALANVNYYVLAHGQLALTAVHVTS
jgi:hypothetical protein